MFGVTWWLFVGGVSGCCDNVSKNKTEKKTFPSNGTKWWNFGFAYVHRFGEIFHVFCGACTIHQLVIYLSLPPPLPTKITANCFLCLVSSWYRFASIILYYALLLGPRVCGCSRFCGICVCSLMQNEAKTMRQFPCWRQRCQQYHHNTTITTTTTTSRDVSQSLTEKS